MYGYDSWTIKKASVQFSHLVVSDSLRPHELQHAKPPCPSSTPGVHSNSRPSRWWCHPAISSSVIPFSSCPQSLPASVFSNKSTLRMRWPKYWSFSFSISPSKEHPGLISFRMDWLDLLAVQGTLKSLLQHHGEGSFFFPSSSGIRFYAHGEAAPAWRATPTDGNVGSFRVPVNVPLDQMPSMFS